MGKVGNQGVLMKLGSQNPLIKLQSSFNEFEKHVKNWYMQHSLEDALTVAFGVAYGATTTAVTSYTLCPRGEWPAALESKVPMLPILVGGRHSVRVRNAAIIGGVYECIRLVMKRTRGKHIQNNIISGFGAGVVVSLVCGANTTTTITNGIFMGLVHGVFYKISGTPSQKQAKDVSTKNPRDVLSNSGLGHDHFEKASLTDKTLPLLTHREEVKETETKRDI